ncbi:MAG: DUF1501 domain-containing protein, partial [Planctomyces sp.]
MSIRPYFPCAGVRALHAPTRREFIYSLGASLGSVALTSLLAEEANKNPLAPRDGHLPAKAKNVIFLMMEGGPSHLDTFDPKPQLTRRHLQQFVRSGRQKSAMEAGQRYYVRSPFRFRRVGQSGADMAENWHCLAEVADELCFFRGCTVDSV